MVDRHGFPGPGVPNGQWRVKDTGQLADERAFVLVSPFASKTGFALSAPSWGPREI